MNINTVNIHINTAIPLPLLLEAVTRKADTPPPVADAEKTLSINAQIRLLVASHFSISEAEADKLLCAYASTPF